MAELLGIVLPLAAGAAISPTVLTLQLMTLSQPVAPLTRSWAISAGYGAVLIAEIFLGLALAFRTGGSDTPSETDAAVKLGFAVILLLLGLRALRAAPKPPKEEPASTQPRISRYFVIGAVLMITNITTTVLFLPAIHDVGSSDVELTGKVAVAFLVFAIALIPAVAPPLGITLLGERAKGMLVTLNAFTSRHRRQINAGICFAFSAFLAAVSLPVLI